MMKDEKKISKKKKYQPLLTFQTRDLGYWTGYTMSEKTTKLNFQSIKCLKIKLKKEFDYTKGSKTKN